MAMQKQRIGSRGRLLRLAAWRGVLASFLGVATAAGAADLRFDVVYAPAPLPDVAGRVLVYELNVRNLDSSACARLVDVRAEGGTGGALLHRRYQGKTIAANALLYDANMAAHQNPANPHESVYPVDVPPGGGVVLFFFLNLADGKPVPATLRHELDFIACADGATAIQTLTGESQVSTQPPVVVGMPFRGDGWVAGDSVNPDGTHRRTLIPMRDANGNLVTGVFYVPERYAIDWVVVNDQAQRAVGPVTDNASYLAFGQQIVAVADGVISRTRDGMPEQTPPENPPPGTQTVETAAGNYIMEDIGGGHYAFYAHLQPGSLLVAEGQHVTRGQVIALLGNTGNSSEPHLHFQVSDANDPLFSEGVPYVFDQFQVTGQADNMNDQNGVFDDYQCHDPVPHWTKMPASYSVLTTTTAQMIWPPSWAFLSGRLCAP
jgi:hypothetical protein